MNPDTNKFEKLVSSGEIQRKGEAIDEVLRRAEEKLVQQSEPEFKNINGENNQSMKEFADQVEGTIAKLFRPNGTPVPKHWTILTIGENIVIKNYTFRVAHIGESYLVLEPVGVPKIGNSEVK